MSEKSIISLGVLFSLCFVALLWFLNQNKTPTTSKACTMEAKLCPDGSAVGRSGPNCDFAPCPNIASSPTPISDTTSNWKTYTDLKNNFELNYPSSWNPSEEALLETGDYFFLSSPNQSIFRVNIVQDSSKSISDYLSKTDKQNLTGYEGTPSITVLSTKITTINNLSCVQRQESYNAAGFSVYSTYYKFGNNIIVLTLQPKAGEINPNDIAVYQQILSTFKFNESKAESLGNWTKRENGSFITNSNCLWFSATQENYTGNLSSFVSKYYGNNSVESMLNSKQYQVKNTQTITSSAQGVGELFTIFFDKNNSKHAITFSVTNQDDVLSTPQCKNYQTDIDYVLNNVDLFI